MSRKKILMLGGSTQQVPAIRKASEMGYETILMDYLPDNPGQYVADRWYQESTTDVEAVCRIAGAEGVSGILAYASDPAALPAAIACERLGLPGNPVRSVEILGVKHKFRQFLQDNNFPSPRNFTFSPDTPLDEVTAKCKELRFPIVIKPTDSSGSKGVSFLDSVSDIGKAIEFANGYSRNKILIAEEFIRRGYPYVIGGDIFVHDGRIVVYGDMECLRDDNGKSLIPTGEKLPNGLTPVQKNILYAELQRLIDCLHISEGELNIEVLIDTDGRPHFLEVGPRAGGNMIPIQLSDAFGIDLIKANIATAMGEDISFHSHTPDGNYMTFVLHSHEEGIYDHIDYSPEIEKFIYRKVEYKKDGDTVEAFDGAGKALGIIFMKFPDPSTMAHYEHHIDEHINVILK